MALHPNHFAVVIGVDNYPGYSSLRGARRDARAFNQWLTDPTGGGLDKAHVELLLSIKPRHTSNSSTPTTFLDDQLRPLHHQIEHAFESILNLASNGGERLYVYFSGHGIAINALRTVLCLPPWSPARKGYALDSESYLNLVCTSGIFREVIFLLDCCRTPVRLDTSMPTTITARLAGSAGQPAKYFVANATEAWNAAYEAMESNGNHAQTQGFFTRALLLGLRGGARDKNGLITASSLKDYLEYHVPMIAQASNRSQNPDIVHNLNNSGLGCVFATTCSTPSPDVIVEFKSSRSGSVALLDGKLNTLSWHNADAGLWRVPNLGKGLYLLHHTDSDEKHSIVIRGDETGEIYVIF